MTWLKAELRKQGCHSTPLPWTVILLDLEIPLAETWLLLRRISRAVVEGPRGTRTEMIYCDLTV